MLIDPETDLVWRYAVWRAVNDEGLRGRPEERLALEQLFWAIDKLIEAREKARKAAA